MKTYWDYSEKERSEMDEVQVAGFLDCELMSKGVLKPAPLVLEPVEEIKLPTETYYRLKRDWRDIGNVLFASPEDAQTVARMVLFSSDRDFETGRDFVQRIDDLSVMAVQLSAEESKAQAKAALVQEKERKERNQKAKDAFEKATEAASKATAAIWSDWQACLSMAREHQKVRDTLADYTKLTEGDEVLATQFLAKAFSEQAIAEAFAWFEMEDPRLRPTCAKPEA